MGRSIALLLSAIFAAAFISAAQAEVLIKIDKSSQTLTVSRDGEPLYTWPVSTGRTGHATPSGTFTAFRMEADHYSKEWDDAPMPHSIFFTNLGHAIHGTYDIKKLGTPASHGCVRLSPGHAATLFAMVKQNGVTNAKVMLTGSEQVAFAQRGSPAARRYRPAELRRSESAIPSASKPSTGLPTKQSCAAELLPATT
jgi:hypothetical protein